MCKASMKPQAASETICPKKRKQLLRKHNGRSQESPRNSKTNGSKQGRPVTTSYREVLLVVLVLFVTFYDTTVPILVLTLGAIGGVAVVAAVLIRLQDRLDRQLVKTPTPSKVHVASSSSCASTNTATARPGPESRNRSVKRPSSPCGTYRTLNPIAEHKLEDEYDFWWEELDSQTQYYALILGYTQYTWDRDYELEDLECEDWDWDEMTREQKAAAAFFGYTKDEWDV